MSMALISTLTRELSWQTKSLLSYSPALSSKQGIRNLAKVTETLSEEAQHRFRELRETYQLGDWAKLCTRSEYIENLYLLDLLDRHIGKPLEIDKGLDIGCRNFSHLPALSAFCPTTWLGIELDANARYLNGLSRRAYGEWMARQREDCRYVAGSLLDLQESVDLIVWTLPFVVRGPLRQWGLPDRFFQPKALLHHAVSLLRDSGLMLIVNQGETEAEAQQELCAEAGMSIDRLGNWNSVFSQFHQPRIAFLFRK